MKLCNSHIICNSMSCFLILLVGFSVEIPISFANSNAILIPRKMGWAGESLQTLACHASKKDNFNSRDTATVKKCHVYCEKIHRPEMEKQVREAKARHGDKSLVADAIRARFEANCSQWR